MKNILILGGGFAGVISGLELRKRFTGDAVDITLIDRNSFHVFTSSLYEVATSEEPQKNIAIPYSQIFKDKVRIIEDEIELIDSGNRKVTLKNQGNLSWDYLLISLGSEPDYCNILGMEEHSIPLKRLSDAVKIKEEIDRICKKKIHQKEKVKLLIGGGGFSGTELAAEMANFRDRLAKKYRMANDFLEVTVIEAKDRLLCDLDMRVSKIAAKKLASYDIKLLFGSPVKEVAKNYIKIDSKGKYPFDILIWTGGIKASRVLKKSGFKTNLRGQIRVNGKLQVEGYDNIFACGDCAEYLDPKTSKPVPGLGQVAEEQGKVAGENIYRKVCNLELKDYHYKFYGYIIPLKGRFVIASLNFIHLNGFFAWVLQQIVFLRYLLRILPLSQAFKKWNRFERSLKQD